MLLRPVSVLVSPAGASGPCRASVLALGTWLSGQPSSTTGQTSRVRGHAVGASHPPRYSSAGPSGSQSAAARESPAAPRHALWGVNTGPEHRCPSPSPPKRARRRPCPAGNSRLHPAWLETGTFSADCRGCLHMGLAWPRACRGASSPAVYLGETPAPLHGAGGWRLTLGLGLVQQRCPGSGCSVHRGAVGCGVRAGVELPPARLPDTALGSTSGRCLLLHPKASQLPPVPRRRASAVPRQPPGLWSPRACTPGAERPEAREVNTGDLA